jgi:DNA-directed RNA polymerase subunit RPC12/RpoP
VSRDPRYLVCPSCEHREQVANGEGDGAIDETDETVCPVCGSGRAYRAHDPALPDAETEAYVKFDAGSAGE